MIDFCGISILYHVAWKVNVLGPLVSEQIVNHEHGPLAIHISMHWKGNLHKFIQEEVESQTILACVQENYVSSLIARGRENWLFLCAGARLQDHHADRAHQ